MNVKTWWNENGKVQMLIAALIVAAFFAIRWIFGGIGNGILSLVNFLMGLPQLVVGLYWNLSIWDKFTPFGEANNLFPTAARLAGLLIIFVVLWTMFAPKLITWWTTKDTKTDKKKTDDDKDIKTKLQKSFERQMRKPLLWWPVVQVPEQASAWIFWTIFGFVIGGVSRVRDKSCLKIPGIELVLFRDRHEKDITIISPQLPVRTSPSVIAGLMTGEREAEQTRLKIAEQRAEQQVGATLSFAVRLTIGLRSGHRIPRRTGGGHWPLIKTDLAYSNVFSEEVKERFRLLVTTRLRDVLKLMSWEDAYTLNGRVFLIGDVIEAVGDSRGPNGKLLGAQRYDRLFNSPEYNITVNGKTVNIFTIDLHDDDQIAAVVAQRTHSLLATIWNFGYRLSFFELEDPNATDEVQKAQENITVAELKRDAQMTEHISLISDKARAEGDARATHARQTRLNYQEIISALLEEVPENISNIPNVEEREIRRRRWIAQRISETFPPDARMQAMMFFEKMRTNVRVAENADNYTYIERGGEGQDLIGSIIAGTAAGQGPRPDPTQPATGKKGDADAARSKDRTNPSGQKTGQRDNGEPPKGKQGA